MSEKLHHRAAVIPQEQGVPVTLDREQRSLEFVVSTEAPVPMLDWQRGGVVPEVLLARGARFPKQVPLLDTHDRAEVGRVLGSVRDLRVEGDRVLGRAVFSSVPKAQEAFTQYAEGHLTDFSAGYQFSLNDVRHVPKGEKAEIGGRTWSGPVNVVVAWTLKEASAVPIGADPAAKARAETNHEENEMTDQERQELEEYRQHKAKREEEAAAKAARDVVLEERTKYDLELARARKAELARQQAIRDEVAKWEAKGFDLGDLDAELIRDGSDVETAIRRIGDVVRDRIATREAYEVKGPIVVTADERDKFRAAASAAVLLRAGRPDLVEEKWRGGHDLAGLSLLELYRKTCQMSNQPFAWNQRTITTSDIPYITGDAMNKLVISGWQSTSVTWRTWCQTATVSNAHTIHLPIPSQVSKAKKINMNDGEYTYLKVSDAEETCELVKPGGLLQISEKAVLNDDMLWISTQSQALGESIAHAVNAMVYGDGSTEYTGVLFGSGGVGETMRDSTALFTSGHANYVAHGSGGVPSQSTLAAAKTALRKQTDISATRPLNWQPRYLIVPAALETTAQRELNSEMLIDGSSTAASGQRNPFFNSMELVVEPLLDSISSDAAAQWYVAADKGKAVWVIFHESTNDRPMLEQRTEWLNDSLTFKGHIKVAAKAADWRGLYCNHGN